MLCVLGWDGWVVSLMLCYVLEFDDEGEGRMSVSVVVVVVQVLESELEGR